ncbi:hypothetical protein ZIOFF_032235 [Zingiber officinale]|uniref:Uncharacterized protein n=1 Tax=Zingiber officinale TaxID=94328 RepID=A0A8J5L5J3_ZINOF|nr:hypothetical protein ZIOFF_035839 [Zingiber officinale]KAG6506903.1 hypothetical protein ZIOFF_032235 [Zingiber officinale]
MGFLFRVRIASFFAGAATASIAGFYLLYKDYMFAHDAIRLQRAQWVVGLIVGLVVKACAMERMLANF